MTGLNALPRLCLSSAENSAKPRHAFLRISGIIPVTWDYEVKVPELETSVFVIPAEHIKNGEERLVVRHSSRASAGCISGGGANSLIE